MRFVAGVVATGVVFALVATARPADTDVAFAPSYAVASGARRPATVSPEALTAVVRGNCGVCHSGAKPAGELVLQGFDVAAAAKSPEVAEKMIRKLQAGMMPPPGKTRPGGDTLQQLALTLEQLVDASVAGHPDPGARTFQRLNRAEYSASVKDLLNLDVDAGAWLPLDTKSANFDNIADVQLPSATQLDAYLDAASAIARLAVGDPKAKLGSTTYKIPRLASQWNHVEGAPMGTRGGISIVHNFPADGEYIFQVSMHAIPTGQIYGSGAPFDEKIEISVNGDRVALLDVDKWSSQADPQGLNMKTVPISVRAGPQRISAAFLKTYEGPDVDLVKRIDHSIADTQIGNQLGVNILAHIEDLVVTGPKNPTGVSETPSRRRIFSCRPTSAAEARPCAEKIVTTLGASAYRRPLSPGDVTAVMAFYDRGAKDGGFEIGIRTAIEALLASPHFVFRVEEIPAGAKPGQVYAINDLDLASRLSFFLWSTPPDAELIALAKSSSLSKPATLQAQAKRMLADPRSQALATRFAAQWLRLQDIDKVHPDALQFPDFHEQLAEDMQHETELFFDALVRENKSVLDLYKANYSYMNETLAKHYGIEGVIGNEFRRVEYPDDRRIGLLGQGSILTLTSVGNRTSPVLRGKWVMEVLLGTPPPPPPPDVPDLEKTGDAKDGHLLTTRERMELHRSNPMCMSCHSYIDPIGLALDNFDVTGQWRIRENGAPLDTRGQLYDGTPVSSPAQLTAALLNRPAPLVRTFTQNLMAYALGRRIEYFDQPTIRRIVKEADAGGDRMSDFVFGIVKSDAFRMRRVPVERATPDPRP